LYRVHLTEAQRAELQRRTRAPKVMPRTRDRLEMVRLSDAGWSIPRIAVHLRLSEKRVRYWLKQFLTGGGFDALPDQPHVGQQSSLTPALVVALQQEVDQSQRTWTARQLADWLAAQHGLRLTPNHLARRLKKAKFSYKRTERGLQHKQDPEQVAERQADLETAEKGAKPVAWTSATSTRRASP
jgi:putative transposase